MSGWEPGARVDDYLLEERLGSGGMASVFRARHVATGAPYALKALASDDPELLLRFEREGRALAALGRHPHVVRVHAAARAAGRAYLVLDLVPGGSLADRLAREGPLPAPEAARLTAQVARAVAHAHAAGILHRDLKPANVLLAGEPGAPRALLADFGLAGALRERSLTRTGDLLGTPGYMAPEQVRGERGVGPATDVYGLGALLYALLTGRPPFVAASPLQALQLIQTSAPAPVRELRPDVPPALERLCASALEKDPAARPPSAAALADALQAALASAAPPARTRRSGALALGAAALLAALATWLAFGAGPSWNGPSQRAARDAPPSPSEPPERDAAPPPDEPARAVGEPGRGPDEPPVDLDAPLPTRDELLERTRAHLRLHGTRDDAVNEATLASPRSFASVGQRLWAGDELPRDRELAALWWRLGAAARDRESMVELVDGLLEGRLTCADPARAGTLAAEAARLEGERGGLAFVYGELLLTGRGGLAVDVARAREQFRIAAERGHGAGAVRWATTLTGEAPLEDAYALALLERCRGDLHARPAELAEAERVRAALLARWPELAPREASEPSLVTVLARRRGDDPLSDALIAPPPDTSEGLCARGEALAWRWSGLRLPERKLDEAIRWYFPAALQGFAKAVRLLATQIAYGEGCAPAPRFAVAVLEQALRALDADGELLECLGALLLDARLGLQAPERALVLMRRSVDAGRDESRARLAHLLLRDGADDAREREALRVLEPILAAGHPQRDEALEALRDAAERGFPRAAARLAELEGSR